MSNRKYVATFSIMLGILTIVTILGPMGQTYLAARTSDDSDSDANSDSSSDSNSNSDSGSDGGSSKSFGERHTTLCGVGPEILGSTGHGLL